MATYEPKNILITGAAGFIASHVANRLVRNYPHYKIVVLDKLDYCSSLKNLNPSRASPNLKFVKGDIASADLVNSETRAPSASRCNTQAMHLDSLPISQR